jgi:hypothetical protein
MTRSRKMTDDGRRLQNSPARAPQERVTGATTGGNEKRQAPSPREIDQPHNPAVPEDPLDEACWESFPASDPPSYSR